jgi:hypothetical protein
MIGTFYRQFSQGISVAGCAAISFLTIGYISDDAHKLEKRKIVEDYEKQLTVLKDENKKIKLEKSNSN